MRIRWTKQALKNLEDIFLFLSKEYPGNYQEIIAVLAGKINGLAHSPQAGRPGRIFGTRELVIGKYPYIVPYRIKDDIIQILRVFHTSRNPPRQW